MFATGVDAIMIGRGALGNPWLIRELVSYFEKGILLAPPTYQERLEMCFHHMEYLRKIKCEKVTVLEMRSHIAWYLKGLPDSIETKNKCFQATTIDELKEILQEYFSQLKKKEQSLS